MYAHGEAAQRNIIFLEFIPYSISESSVPVTVTTGV